MLSWSAVVLFLEWGVRLTMLPVVIRRKTQPAVCLAWLTIIFLIPLVGLTAYLLIGEIRLGTRRLRRYARDVDVITRADRPDIQLKHIVQPEIEKTQEVILHVADELGGLRVLGGNTAELLSEQSEVIDRLVRDIDEARHHAHLLFYIFAADEVGGRVLAALERARARGVRCRLLADAVGSHGLFRAAGANLAQQGIEAIPMLPVNPVRRLFERLDVRNHRKLAVIDGRVAYTGSQNIIRPDYGKKGLGEYRDLMVRLVGPSVSQLQAVFLEDWEFETAQCLDDPEYFPPPQAAGSAVFQVAPGGPHYPTRILRDLAVEGLHAARRRVGIITPYFVPDEALLVALRLAVVRGVRVDLIVPERNDQFWAGLAGQFFIDEMLRHGVRVHLYQPGFLHVKSMTVDDGFAMLGTANFDIRSFYLNFELNLLSYDADINGLLRFYESQCIRESKEVELTAWRTRGRWQQCGAQFAKLLSPLL